VREFGYPTKASNYKDINLGWCSKQYKPKGTVSQTVFIPSACIVKNQNFELQEKFYNVYNEKSRRNFCLDLTPIPKVLSNQDEIRNTVVSLGLPEHPYFMRRAARAMDLLDTGKVNFMGDEIFRVHSQFLS